MARPLLFVRYCFELAQGVGDAGDELVAVLLEPRRVVEVVVRGADVEAEAMEDGKISVAVALAEYALATLKPAERSPSR